MRRVLMISPHFPPDTSAATHRVRLLAPHLAKYGWEPTVVSVDPRDYEGRLDPDLASLVPRDLRVVRCRAWPARVTRRVGIGDLGLRAFKGLLESSARLLRSESFDVMFVTIYPTYPALLGPLMKRRFGVPFVLDYQDPWVGAWGRAVGPGGRPDLRSRITRAVAVKLEPHVIRAVDAITAVSRATHEQVQARYPELRRAPCAAIPLGGEPADFDRLRRQPRPNPYFDATDGQVHACFIGTLPPLGLEALRALFRATKLLSERRPELSRRLRLHFFGTSGRAASGAAGPVLPVAREMGVDASVSEVGSRLDYLDALTVQTQASAILMTGSTEPHYTASRLYPAVLAGRPIVALFHEGSSVVEILRAVARPPAARVVTYDDVHRAGSRVEAIYTELAALVGDPAYAPDAVDAGAMRAFSAEHLAGKLAAVLGEARGL